MYYFLSMLSISDLVLSLSSLPTTLGLFLFGVHGIHAAACFAQEFFIHLFTVTEASVLLVMAFDQYVAIHNPPRYSTILTSSWIIKTGVLVTSKNIILIIPLPFLLQRLTYCHQNLLLHSTVSTRVSWRWPALTTESMLSMDSVLPFLLFWIFCLLLSPTWWS